MANASANKGMIGPMARVYCYGRATISHEVHIRENSDVVRVSVNLG